MTLKGSNNALIRPFQGRLNRRPGSGGVVTGHSIRSLREGRESPFVQSREAQKGCCSFERTFLERRDVNRIDAGPRQRDVLRAIGRIVSQHQSGIVIFETSGGEYHSNYAALSWSNLLS